MSSLKSRLAALNSPNSEVEQFIKTVNATGLTEVMDQQTAETYETIVRSLTESNAGEELQKAVKELHFQASLPNGAHAQAILAALADFDFVPSLGELLRHVAKLAQKNKAVEQFIHKIPPASLANIRDIQLVGPYAAILAALAADKFDDKAQKAVRDLQYHAKGHDNAQAKSILTAVAASGMVTATAELKNRVDAINDGSHEAARFMLKVPVATFGDSTGSRVADAYEAVVHGLASGKMDQQIKNAVAELQYQANMHNNPHARMILSALDDFGLAPAGIYDNKLTTEPLPRAVDPQFPKPEPT